MSEIELQDAIIRQALELQRLSASEEARALDIVREMERDLSALLARQELNEAGRRQIEALIREAREVIEGHYGTIAGQVDTRELVLIVADKTVATLGEVLPAASLPSPERLASLSDDILIHGTPAAQQWKDQAAGVAKRFAAEVRMGVIEGATQEQIVARIVGRGDEPGFMDKARRDVRALVHSSVMTAANRARMDTFKKNSKHIKGVRVLATLDSRTCMTCAFRYDGTEWDFDGKPLNAKAKEADFRLPTYHWNCRCIASPIPKGLDDIFGTSGLDDRLDATRTRASKDGPTTATTFSEFLKRQSPEFVEEMLGEARADLWRKGRITLTDLVSGSGRPLTLDDIRAR